MIYNLLLSPKVFYHPDNKGRNEKELDGIAYCCHKTASGQIHTALYPEPAGRYGVRPTDDADDEADDSRQSA